MALEIRCLGYPSFYTTVRAYLQPFRTLATVPPVLLGPPKVRQVTAWMLHHPNNRTADEQIRLKQVLANCTHLAATARHVSAFGEMISSLHGDRLTTGSARSAPTTCRTCTPSPPAYNKTAPRCSTA